MRLRARSTLFVLCLLLSRVAVAQQLFPDGAGWFARGDAIYLTPSWGTQWREITPPVPKGYSRSAVFFLDGTTGWVFLVGSDDPEHPKRDQSGTEIVGLKIAATTDSGATWSTWDARLPDYRHPLAPIAGKFTVWFTDSDHGWMNMELPSSANFALGALLATRDGGHSWQELPNGPGVRGDVAFATAKSGWIVGGPGQEHVYNTEDGGKNWQEVFPKAPPDLGPKPSHFYLPVHFQGRKQVFLPAIYSLESASTFVLFSTQDRGDKWKRIVTVSIASGNWLVSDVVGSNLVTAEIANQSFTLTTFTAAGETSKQQATVPSVPYSLASTATCPAEVYRLIMTDQNRGWALITCPADGGVLLTQNGGRSWTDVTPKPKDRPKTELVRGQSPATQR